jgi:hypothetical protein
MKYETEPETRQKIDEQLHQLAIIQSHLGTDSTKSEFKKALTKQARILEKIKVLDEEFYKTIVPDNES